MSLYYGNRSSAARQPQPARLCRDTSPPEKSSRSVTVSPPSLRDRVAIYLGVGCGNCEVLPQRISSFAPWQCVGFDVDGGNADYIVVPAGNCLTLPDEISFRVRRSDDRHGGYAVRRPTPVGVSGTDTVAMFGIGPMGGAGILVAKGRGARVIAVDILESRLEQARGLGADGTINSRDENPRRGARSTGGRGVDVAIDCSGSPAGQNAALDSAAKFGRVAFIGESRRPRSTR